MVLSSQLYINL